MPKETYYFQHDYNSRGDLKLVALIKKRGLAGIGAYWCIVEMLYEQDGYLPLEFEDIAYTLKAKSDLIKSVVEDFKLFKNDGVKFWSESVLSRLKRRHEKSEQAKENIKKRWQKKPENDTSVLPHYNNGITTSTSGNTIKEKESKEKEIKGEERKEDESIVSPPPQLSDFGEYSLIPIELLAEEALGDEMNFVSHVVNQNRHHNLNPEKIKNHMHDFLAELKSNAEFLKERKDFRQYFKNWLPKVLNKPVTSTNRNNDF